MAFQNFDYVPLDRSTQKRILGVPLWRVALYLLVSISATAFVSVLTTRHLMSRRKLHPLNLPANTGIATTLGFSQIFVINLDSRPDRITQLNEVTDFLHLSYERVRANTSEEAPDDNHTPSSHRACWLSHMNVYHRIANDPLIEDALIAEDDIDFSLDLHMQTAQVMRAVRNDNPAWDMVYLGHCSGVEAQQSKVVDAKLSLYRSTNPICTHGYAVSKKGARKLLQVMEKFTDPLDLMLIHAVADHRVESYSVAQPLIVQYHFSGDRSDINMDGGMNDNGDPLVMSTRERIDLLKLLQQS
ncbi:hypothetical protein IWQ60_006378 [Tieghemiomyces parasiticus]|uniref:Glycosyl transferase family 25 domain-containing protein n=1 Tax=Tieghemiomyces parasiticus TaxID=78921 RepID=A0A9W8A4G9_9FUNG|nr:hypothetical protein IWQ60_006378 [Tieghemiomyces parasiticus]